MPKICDLKDKSPNPDLIEHLEVLLAQVKAGEVRSLAYAVGWDDDSVGHSLVCDNRNTQLRLLAEVHLLLADITTQVQLQRSDSVLINRLREYLPL